MRIAIDFEKCEIILKDFAEDRTAFFMVLEAIAYSPRSQGIKWEANGEIFDDAIKLAQALDAKVKNSMWENSVSKIPQ